jgi:hypothetical protein
MHRHQPRPHQVAHRLVRRVRHPDRRKLARTVQLRQADRVPPVGLDPVPGPARDQRRCDDRACVASLDQLPVHAITAWAGLVAEAQLIMLAPQLDQELAQRCRRVLDCAKKIGRVPQATPRNRNRDRRLMHVQTNECGNLSHDPSPICLRLGAGPSGATLDIGILPRGGSPRPEDGHVVYHPERSSHRVTGEKPQSPHLF